MHPVVFVGETAVTIENSISFVFRNPIFNEDGTPGSFIFDFSIPLTPGIKEEINFSNNPQAADKVYKKQVSIVAGSFNIAGTGTLTEIDDQQVNISMKIFNSSLRNVFEDKKLHALDLGVMSPLVNYKTHMKRGIYGWGYAWSPTMPTNLINDPIYWRETVSDPHETFQPPINTSRYTAPAAGSFTFTLSLLYKVHYGKRLRIAAIKNDAMILFYEMIGDVHMGQDLSNVFSFTADLAQNDEVEFVFRMDGMLSWNPMHQEDQYRAQIDMHRTSELFVYSSLNIEHIVDRGYPFNDYTLLPVFNNAFFENSPDEVFAIDHDSLSFINEKFPYLNYYNNGFPLLLSASDGNDSYQAFNIISPQLFLPFVISKIFEQEGISIENNLFDNDGHINQLCIYANACLNNVVSSSFSQIELDYQLAKALPNIPILDFLMQVCKTLGIVFDYNHHTKTIAFKYLDDIIKDDSAVEFSDNIIGKPAISINRYSGYIIKYPDPTDGFIAEYFKDLSDVNYKGELDSIYDVSWVDQTPNDCYFCRFHGVYFIYRSFAAGWSPIFHFYSQRFGFERSSMLLPVRGVELFEYTLGATPIMMRDHPKQDASFGSHRGLLTPGSLRPGKIVGIPNDEESYHLMFYRGMRKDGDNNDYPLGSNSYFDLTGEIDFSASYTEPLDLSLDTGPNSLFTKRFSSYLQWRVRTHGEYTFYKQMTSHEIASLDLFKWYSIMGMDYLIKEVKFEISKTGLSPVQITALPRTSPPTFAEQPNQSQWILADGQWNMSGVWLHDEKWNMET